MRSERKEETNSQQQADKRRSENPDFNIGDLAFVSAKHIRTTRPTYKFSETHLGPFEIIGWPNPNSVTLRLPDYLRGIHPVFHVSQVEPYTPSSISGREVEPPPPVVIDGEPEYEIAAILDSKFDRRRRVPLLYYVRWLGYEGTEDEYSWLSADELDHAKEYVDEFHKAYPEKPGPLESIISNKSRS